MKNFNYAVYFIISVAQLLTSSTVSYGVKNYSKEHHTQKETAGHPTHSQALTSETQKESMSKPPQVTLLDVLSLIPDAIFNHASMSPSELNLLVRAHRDSSKLREVIVQSAIKEGHEFDFSDEIIGDQVFKNLFGKKGILREIKRLKLLRAQFNLELLEELPSTLTDLNLARTSIRISDVVHLQHLTNLISLDISGREYESKDPVILQGDREAGIQSLATHFKNLKRLSLRAQGISDEEFQKIAKNLSELTTLDIGHNRIGDKGATVLALELQKLTRLNIDWNQIGNQGAKAIAEHSKELTRLDMGLNRLNKEGALALAQGLEKLTFLGLRCSGLMDSSREAVAAALPKGATFYY